MDKVEPKEKKETHITWFDGTSIFIAGFFVGLIAGLFLLSYIMVSIASSLHIEKVDFSMNETAIANTVMDRLEKGGYMQKVDLPAINYYGNRSDNATFWMFNTTNCCYPSECGIVNPPNCTCTYPVQCFRMAIEK